jgi:predicted metal-binding membrane protein
VLTPLCILCAAAVAWVYMLHLEQRMSAGAEYRRAMIAMGMTVGPEWTLPEVLLTFAMWVVMMIGMMAPSASPVLVLFRSTRPRTGGNGTAAVETAMFGVGYAAIWVGFSAAATLLQIVLRQSSLLSDSMAVSDPYLSGSILIAAGLYQLTTWKNVCLAHCRSPLGFLMHNWRAGKSGAFNMGWRHGLHCVGCCWALMSVLFAVGCMNLVWVAALTIFVLLEKAGPRGATVARLGGFALIALGGVTIAQLL